MVPLRIKSINLAIEHVREPGQWMPIVGMKMGEGPNNPAAGQASYNLRIFVDVDIVIEVYEIVPQCRKKGDPSKRE